VRQAGRRDALKKLDAGPFAQQAHRLVDGGQRRLASRAVVDVVEPDHGDLFRHPDAGRGERAQHPDGHLVVGGHHGIREVIPGFREDPPSRCQAAFNVERAGGRADQTGGRMVAQRLLKPDPPLGRVRHAGRAVDVIYPAFAVLFNQVRNDGGRPGPVIGGDYVNFRFGGVARDDGHRHPAGQPLQQRGREAAGTDQYPVHLAGDRR
jgi:hypothetical protein